jgi:hypothetical protein
MLVETKASDRITYFKEVKLRDRMKDSPWSSRLMVGHFGKQQVCRSMLRNLKMDFGQVKTENVVVKEVKIHGGL